MGHEEINALIKVLEAEKAKPNAGLALGTWAIKFDKKRSAFVFDKCENEGYCEERPAVIATSGEIVDAGGPLFG